MPDYGAIIFAAVFLMFGFLCLAAGVILWIPLLIGLAALWIPLGIREIRQSLTP